MQAFIIDDNANNIEVLQMLLTQQNITSITVQSPSEVGRTIAALETFDVIFVDLEFPNGSGYQVLESLRGVARLRGTPIIAYSVHTSELDRARLAGFDGFLGKPIQAQKFPEQLRRILTGESIWEV